MASMNKVILIGNLTRDPEHKQTSGGADVCKFSLALNERYKDRDGNMQESVTFVDCSAWGAQAPPIAQYCRKGSCVSVEGSLKLDKWETQEGEKRQKLCVTARSVQFLTVPRELAESEDQTSPVKAEDEDQSVDDLPF